MAKRRRALRLARGSGRSAENPSKSTRNPNDPDATAKSVSDAPQFDEFVTHNEPKLVESADNLDAIQKSVADASSVSAGLWLSYLFVLFYFAVAAGAVTHADLLLENPVKLPFLNIELPLLAFFFLAPLIFLVVHAFTMVHFVLLAKKAVRFHHRLYEAFPGPDGRNSVIRDGLRQQLPSNIFVQFLAGPSDIRDTGFGRLLKFIAWTTLVFGPVALLLMLQIQFLPYHQASITWAHRVALMTDLLIVWWLWRKILGGRVDLRGWRAWKTWAKASVAVTASACTILFSYAVATFPGEWQQTPLKWFAFAEPTGISTAIFNGNVDPITRRRTSWSSNTLVVPGLNFTEARKGELKERSIDLRGRRLEGAVFDGASFGKEADLTGAYLQGASLRGARLQAALFNSARLQDASLALAHLQGSSFEKAQLTRTGFGSADLQGASFFDADIQDAGFGYAHLHGVTFFLARLTAVTFEGAELYGASFERAHLAAVDLSRSYLWRTNWDENETSARTLRAVAVHWGPEVLQFGPYGGAYGGLTSRGFVQWNDEFYASLKKQIESLPEGEHRVLALQRIAQLDCRDRTLTPCNQPTPVPKVFSSAVESNEDEFRKVRTAELDKLACREASVQKFIARAGLSPCSGDDR
jgi:uncharacterized protein YjbI with pentapeptide repeats